MHLWRGQELCGGLHRLLGCHSSEPPVGFSIEASLRGEEVKTDDIALLGVSLEARVARCCLVAAVDCDWDGWMVGVAGSELLGDVVRIGAIRSFAYSACTPADGPACPCRLAEPGGESRWKGDGGSGSELRGESGCTDGGSSLAANTRRPSRPS